MNRPAGGCALSAITGQQKLRYARRNSKYYITESDALSLGWQNWLGNLSAIAPGKMITKGMYKNRDGHLPSAEGRVWYEADINYTQGFRGTSRVLYSNDGLIFVTYDHYHTFSENV